MDDLTTESSFDSQGMWVIDVLDLYSDMLSMGVCIPGWKTSGRLVQELNVCTVVYKALMPDISLILNFN